MSYFKNLQQELEKYLEPEQIQKIERAYVLARNAHRGQKRQSGDPYITHPVAAALILAEMKMDSQSIMAALLHDVLEDTVVTKAALIREFGKEVADLVDGVSKLEQIKFSSRAEAQAESFRKMVMAMVKDIRVILVKLADRLHNMRTLGSLSFEKRRLKALETLEIYAPIANRLGMHNLYIELEDLGFKALYPMRYRVLEKAVESARGHRSEIVEVIRENLTKALGQNGITGAHVLGRKKHLYSIYKKMRHKSTSFTEIMDVYAFRVIVKDIDTCYRVLGIVHRLYKPIHERFKDYVAIPKVNSYQSLHTTLFGPYGVPIEVQIRTEDMDLVAEKGIASHWLYKATGLDAEDARHYAYEWIKGLFEIQQNTGNSIEFFENVKVDLFPDEVYVFTPKGDILKLPKGSTPVDFAYAVHSDIGNTCVAAKINKHLAPLSIPLSNGEQVEIITSPFASPNPAWLNFVISGKARSNIRHFLKSQQRTESIELGQRLLSHALAIHSKTLKDVKESDLKALLNENHYESIDDLYEALGLGNEVSLVVAKKLLRAFDNESLIPNNNQILPVTPLLIKGTEGVVVHFAECCRPIPGDTIVGHIKAGQGIVVHLEQCKELETLRYNPEQLLYVRWEDKIQGEFKADIVIEVENQRRVLAMLAGAIADADSNIDNITVEPGDGRTSIVELTLSVKDRKHLAHVMRKIRILKSVIRMARKKNMH